MDEIRPNRNGDTDGQQKSSPENRGPCKPEEQVLAESSFVERLTRILSQVLRVEKIGIQDNFISLGGDSLKAIKAIGLINKQLNTKLSVRDLFNSPTVADLCELITETTRIRLTETDCAADNSNSKSSEQLPLSFAQRRLWFLHQLEEKLTAYNMRQAFRLSGVLNQERLRKSLEEIVTRHEPLRTLFASHEGQPYQIIQASQPFELPEYDLSGCSIDDRELAIRRLKQEEDQKPFDLSRDLMLRAKLIRLTETEHLLLLTQHHIASDGWSDANLWNELSLLYSALEVGIKPSLPELKMRYCEYGQWQKERLDKQNLERLKTYWRDKLDKLPPVILPIDNNYPEKASFRGKRYEFTIEPEIYTGLENLARNESSTLQIVLLATLKILLNRYSGQEDIGVGIPVAGRMKPEAEPLIGFFINTLLIRGNLAGNPTFLQLLKQIRNTSLDAYDHQELPFEMLVEELQPDRKSGHNPLVQVLFQMMQFEDRKKSLGSVKVEPDKMEASTTHFDLEMHFWTTGTSLHGRLLYSTDLFRPETIERMASHYQALLRDIIAHPEKPIAELSILVAEEQRQILLNWSGISQMEPPLNKCVHELFEEQVKRTPDQLALVFGNRRFTYQELNDKATILALRLQCAGLNADQRVGIWADRSPEVLVGILAILKAGGCYVPLDPSYPMNRLAFMLEDCGARLLLVQKESIQKLPPNELEIIILEEAFNAQDDTEEKPDEVLRANRVSNPNTLAYVLYTSGSTGQPKGVAMPHGPLTNLVNWQRTNTRSGSAPRTLQYSSLSFDASFHEMFSTWSSGGTLVMVNEDTRRDFNQLWDYLCEEKIERLFMPFVALQMLAFVFKESGKKNSPDHLREIITAGEQLRITPEIAKLFEHLRDCRLSNHYGPTESHVVTVYPLPESPADWTALPPIGRPITNTVIRILDDNNQPVPVGVTGELYIGGHCLARGYLNDEELTKEKFGMDPLEGNERNRLYRSGDLARWQSDGNIEFLGRRDSQIKIRGYRVEPGEIETLLAKQPGVGQCVVVAREALPDSAFLAEKSNKLLVAYLVPSVGHQSIEVEKLNAILQQSLPEYMIPAAYVILETMPLSPTGKIDHKSLPIPDETSRLLEDVSLEPRSNTEKAIHQIWGEFLNVEGIGLNDNFFALGGHSLLAMRVIASIQSELDLKVTVRNFFDNPTVAEMASLIDAKLKENKPLDTE